MTDLGWLQELFGAQATLVAVAVLVVLGAKVASVEYDRHRTRRQNFDLEVRKLEVQRQGEDTLAVTVQAMDRELGTQERGRSLAEAVLIDQVQDPQLQGWTQADSELAGDFWGKLSDRGRRLFGHLARNAPRRFTGEQLSALLDIPNGVYGVAGVLAWPGRHAKALGRRLPLCWENGEYWMTEEQAALLRPHYALEGLTSS